MSNDDFQNFVTLASLIGNMVQTINSIEKNSTIDLQSNDMKHLLQDNHSLQKQLKQLYDVYIDLKKRAEQLKNINDKLVENIEDNESEIKKLKAKIISLEQGLE